MARSAARRADRLFRKKQSSGLPNGHGALASRKPLPDKSEAQTENRVPSLIRFVVIVGILAGIVYGCMIALVTFIEPLPREMSQTIPAARLNK